MTDKGNEAVVAFEADRAAILALPTIAAKKRDAEARMTEEVNRLNDELLQAVFTLGFNAGCSFAQEKE